ncbi:MAG: malonyl-CoA decarboxylase [Kiritimatiellia bacterium]
MSAKQQAAESTAHHYTAKIWRQTLATLRGRESRAAARDEKLVQRIAGIIESPDGDPAGKARAIELGMAYLEMNAAEKLQFFHTLATEFDSDRSKVKEAARQMAGASDAERVDAELKMRAALIPPRVELFRQLNLLPDGFRFLINMRADLLLLAGKDAALKKLDEDLKALLASWFDVGLLDLVEITWDSPASLLEKLMGYEAVHQIRSWDDMKHRLYSDRRCFGFFHGKLPNTPLIFVEVALVNGMADNIQKLLDESALPLRPEDADTAIFYSISNTQKGLAGIRLGNFLIKTVVEKLSAELRGLKYFATLSPVPGFMTWLAETAQSETLQAVLTERELAAIMDLSNNNSAHDGLLALLGSAWPEDKKLARALMNPVMKLCAQYIVRTKKNGHALDPVTHFHMTNGARLERINWLADTSERGLKQSAGIMVNYRYDPASIAENHAKYMSRGFLGTSREARQWLS